jgi:hypothetical protein
MSFAALWRKFANTDGLGLSPAMTEPGQTGSIQNLHKCFFLNGAWLPAAELLYIHECKINVRQAIAEMKETLVATCQELRIGDVSAHFSLKNVKSDQACRDIVSCMSNLAKRFPEFKHVVKTTRVELFFFNIEPMIIKLAPPEIAVFKCGEGSSSLWIGGRCVTKISTAHLIHELRNYWK